MEQMIGQLAHEFQVSATVAKQIISMTDAGDTIPFIARYRKERTGSMDDQTLRRFCERLRQLRGLEERREAVRRAISEQQKLTDELNALIQRAATLQELEDIYRPFRPKRRTRAEVARLQGLAPLAETLMTQSSSCPSPEQLAAAYVRPQTEIKCAVDALSGAMDILAEQIAENPTFRAHLRRLTFQTGVLRAKAKKREDSVYRMYYDYQEPVRRIAAHRVLAINRGEREDWLTVSLDADREAALQYLERQILKPSKSAARDYVRKAIADSYTRLLAPSLENEIRAQLKERAEQQAMQLFQSNLRNLLLTPPLRQRVILGLDPAYRTGCKLAVIDETGRPLDTAVIYPTPPHNRVDEAKAVFCQLVERYRVEVVAIGNGTAGRESEQFVAQALQEVPRRVSYAIVDEAGASVYSASPLGAEEFPEYDVSLRSAISIARRLLDPLSELVKIDPKSIGVGQYQHDMNQKRLSETLDGVVEDCVNAVGVNVNTASWRLLACVAGISVPVAKNIVACREASGGFTGRQQLRSVPKLGPKTFEQCAGFLRIPEAEYALDNTAVHPESYAAAESLLKLLGYTMQDIAAGRLGQLREQSDAAGLDKLAETLGIGRPTLCDIIGELTRPGRDIRDQLPPPHLRSDVLEINDLAPGMTLHGTVRNVTDFGAFVDIGVHQDGLVHLSEMSERYVRHPSEVVKTGDAVTVRVLSVDAERKRIALSMKDVTSAVTS